MRAPTRLLFTALLAALLSLPGTAVADQTAAEGRLDLRDLLARLPGRYDNEPQRFFLEGTALLPRRHAARGGQPATSPRRHHAAAG